MGGGGGSAGGGGGGGGERGGGGGRGGGEGGVGERGDGDKGPLQDLPVYIGPTDHSRQATAYTQSVGGRPTRRDRQSSV